MKWNKTSAETPPPEANQALSSKSEPEHKAAFESEASPPATPNPHRSSLKPRIPPILLEGDTSPSQELGYYQPDRQWRALATSERVVTPAETLSEPLDVQFATFALEPPPAAPAKPPPPVPSAPAVREAPAPVPPAPVLAWLPEALRTPGAHAPPEPFQGASGEAGPECGANDKAASQVSSGVSAGAHPDSGGGMPLELARGNAGAKPPEVPPWTPAQEHALAELIGWSLLKQEWLSSADIAQVLHGQPPLLPASVEAAQVAPVLGALGVSSLSAARPLEVSSPGAAGLPPAKDFWVAVNAELVVYGATQPDAQVSIGGRPIQLRSDGSFSYRFALPDGNYTLRIRATSAQGDARQADLEFSRSTRHTGEVGAHPQDPALQPPERKDVR